MLVCFELIKKIVVLVSIDCCRSSLFAGTLCHLVIHQSINQLTIEGLGDIPHVEQQDNGAMDGQQKIP